MKELLVATRNKGKIKELKTLIPRGKNLRLRPLADFQSIPDVEETGNTFEENASLKATSYSTQTGLWSLADDSGLEVASLGNKPGIYSARYAGEDASDEENFFKLLEDLNAIKNPDRSAQFVCVICIADKNGRIRHKARGICKGTIALNPSGTNGFGYDPVFVPKGFHQSFGELSGKIKRDISHRAIAMKKIIEYLLQIAPS